MLNRVIDCVESHGMEWNGIRMAQRRASPLHLLAVLLHRFRFHFHGISGTICFIVFANYAWLQRSFHMSTAHTNGVFFVVICPFATFISAFLISQAFQHMNSTELRFQDRKLNIQIANTYKKPCNRMREGREARAWKRCPINIYTVCKCDTQHLICRWSFSAAFYCCTSASYVWFSFIYVCWNSLVHPTIDRMGWGEGGGNLDSFDAF